MLIRLQVDEIAKVDGIDVLLVGPFDLANNIGYPIITEMHEELVKAIEKIHKAVVDNGKRIGMLDVHSRSLVKILRFSQGYTVLPENRPECMRIRDFTW